MTRALLWKELREQRALVLATWAIALVLPAFLLIGMRMLTSGYSMAALAGITPMALLTVVWPMMATATGALSVSSDLSDESLRLLLSRPVSRERVWAVKVGAALLAFAAAVVGSAAIAYLFDSVIAGSVPNNFWNDLDAPAAYAALLPTLFLFACAHYCSLFFRRPLAAALMGALVAAVMGALVFGAWLLLAGIAIVPSGPAIDNDAYRVQAAFFETGAQWAPPIAIAGLLAAAYWMFRRSEWSAGRAAPRIAQPLAAVAVLVAVVGAVPASYASMRSMADTAAGRVGDLRVHGDSVIIPLLTEDRRSTFLAAQPIAGGDPVPLTGRDTTLPARTPDGEWIVYARYRSSVRPIVGAAHLRAMRPDGSDDHAISGDLPGWHWTWSSALIDVAPDSDHVLFFGGRGSQALLASIESGPQAARVIDLDQGARDRGRYGAVIGWAAGTGAELLRSVVVGRRSNDRSPLIAAGGTPIEWGDAMRKVQLLATDAASDGERVVIELPGGGNFFVVGVGSLYGRRTLDRWAWLPVRLAADGAPHLLAVSVASGELIDLTASPCDLWGITPDGGILLYGECRGDVRDDDYRADLRLRDLAAGTEEPFAVMHNYTALSPGRPALLSPDGNAALFYGRHGFGSWSSFVIERGGEPRRLAEQWVPLAWLGRGDALLMNRFVSPLVFRVVDVNAHADEAVFP